MNISGSTTMLGLIGSPVGHSKSPEMYNYCFKKYGCDCAYLAFDVTEREVGKAVNAVRTFQMRGANVTMPLKNAVLPYLDRLTPAAQITRSVNTIVNDGGVLTGHCTDGKGFTANLASGGFGVKDKKITILGGGGVSSAVAAQCVLEGAEELSVFNRKDKFWESLERYAETLRSEALSCSVNIYDLDDEEALKEFMSTKDRVVVMGHKITDVDALGAGIGIYRAGKTLGKPVHIVINDPTTSIRPLMSGFMENPDYEPSMFVDSNQAKELVDNNTVVIVVDTNKPSYTECQDLLYMTKTIVVLDHHRRGSEVIQNAVLSYVEPYASSSCEMIAEILQYFADGLKLRSIEADCIYAGIMIDTNNFTTRAGVRTFEAAAFLRRCGADVTRVRKMLRDNIDSYKARAEAVRTAEIYRDYFAIARCPSEGLESPTVVGAQAANELLNIAGVKASFVLTSYNNEVYISARAIDEVNVQVMMERMGGGGHLNIAGAQVKDTMDETERMLKEIIDQLYQEGDK